MFLKKILTYLFLILWLVFTSYNAFADWIVDFDDPSWNTKESSIEENGNGPVENIEEAWIKIMSVAKVIINGVLLVYLVYVWATLIMSMWENEEDLSSSKRQMRYALTWLVFINIPWSIYDALNTNWHDYWWGISNQSFTDDSTSWILVNSNFGGLLNNIIRFIEVIIFIIAVFAFLRAWIWIMTSRWREEKMKESITKLIYWSLWLIFVWIIEIWKYTAFSWDIDTWYDIFGTLFQVAMFFVWVTVTSFLVLASYYYLTSNGDEERVKKAKSIVINTFIAIVILLASYSFLTDLLGL